MQPSLSRAVASAASVAVVSLILGASTAAGQAGPCPTNLTPSSYSAPVVGTGWIAQLVAKGLRTPRGLKFDSNGALLVVEKGTGIRYLTFNDHGGTCLTIEKDQSLLAMNELNHGIELSDDGKTLYASGQESVYSWEYDPTNGSVKQDSRKVLVKNMSSTDHVSRTLTLSRKTPGTLLVSKGSASNMDANARDINSGISQIRAFDVGENITIPQGGYDYPSQGVRVGWGLRNSVGVAEHPVTGGVFSVENSADQVRRLGQDVHQNNPGEEMNYHGFLNGTKTPETGANYGYPDCFALWDTDVPQLGSLAIGSQFALNPTAGGDQATDDSCKANHIAPRLTFQAHTAPLDIKFASDGSEAYITFHGSWNRDTPTGYKLSMVRFENGDPVDAADSQHAAVDIMSNADNNVCPTGCFRPVGLAIDGQGRVYMSSDSTGDIWVLRKVEVSAGGAAGTGGGGGGQNGGGRIINQLSYTGLLGTVLLTVGLCLLAGRNNIAGELWQ